MTPTTDLSEKWRPKRLADIIGQDAIIEELQGYVRARGAPHLLFSGPPGTGKSTAAQAYARDWYNGEYDAVAPFTVMELNASDDRNIDVMRRRVLGFLTTSSFSGHTKILILEEADGITGEAQNLLRRPLEQTRNVTVIFTVNKPEALIDALRSRVRELAFKPVPAEDVKARLVEIVAAEGYAVDDAVRNLCAGLAARSQGDLRKALKDLQGLLAAGGVGPVRLLRAGLVR